MDLSFQTLSYSLTTSTGEAKEILHEVSGYCQAGRMLAVMGRSGAGKTTLLDVLACHTRGGMLTGEVLVNGQLRDASAFKRASCYVMQQDILLHTATVKEALTTSALLHLPRSLPRAALRAHVEALIHELGLQECANTMIGDEARGMRGISGGERRRVSMGLELVTQPAVVFLDEPTSGLDSDTALSMVRLLCRLAAHNRTVVCTIHQPSSDIVECFQDLLLLASGRLCFCGPWDHAVPFLSDAGLPCPLYKNPADFLMTLTADASSVDVLVNAMHKLVDAGELQPPLAAQPPANSAPLPSDAPKPLEPPTRSNPTAHAAPSRDVEQGTDNNTPHKSANLQPQLPTAPSKQNPEAPMAGVDHSRADRAPPAELGHQVASGLHLDGGGSRPPGWYQTWVLLVRFFRSWRRDPMLLASEAFQYIFYGVTIGLMYFQLSDSTSKAPFNRSSMIWFILAILCFTPAMTAIVSWDAERVLLRRESAVRAYPLWAYFLAKTIIVTPMEAVLSSMLSVTVYFMAGFQMTAAKFLVHLLVMVLFQVCSETVGLLCAVASKTSSYALVIVSVVLIYLLSFSGILLNEVPVYFKWVPVISYLNYAYVAMLKNELYGLELRAPGGAVIMAQTMMPPGADNGLSIGQNIAVLGSMTVAFRVLGFILLYIASKLHFV